jgi:hypothetical protein
MIKQTHRQNITAPEIFEYVNKQETPQEKAQALAPYRNMIHMKWIVNAVYNFDFTGYPIPQYQPNHSPPGICNGHIGNQLKRIESAITCYQKGNKQQYEKIMTIVLESVSRDEALLLERIFNNKKIDGISKTIWKKVFPEFFRFEQGEEEVS